MEKLIPLETVAYAVVGSFLAYHITSESLPVEVPSLAFYAFFTHLFLN